MKKTLLALAVLGLSGAAMAQSSVTLYGVADAGFSKISGEKVKLGSGLNGSSRIGLKGVEDLGGGLKAGFRFESAVDLSNGNAGSSTNVSASAVAAGEPASTFWARQANIFIGGNFGTFQVGRQSTPSNLANALYDLTGQAGYAINDQSAGMPSRANRAIAYVSPTFGGLTVAVATVLKDDATYLYGTTKAIYDVALMYNNGPIAAGLSANKIGQYKTQYQVGAKYTFQNFVVSANFNANDSNLVSAYRTAGLGVGFNYAGFSLVLDYNRVLKSTTGTITSKMKNNGLLEAKYALSKRTFVYTFAKRQQAVNRFGVGVRHNF